MTERFSLNKVQTEVSLTALDFDSAASHSLIALNIETKIQFQNPDGSVFHEYILPSDRDIQNCGGYVDKMVKYNSPEVRSAVKTIFHQQDGATVPLPAVLMGRSFLVDTLLTRMLSRFLDDWAGRRAKILDHGCTVAEHYDMLDQMLDAATGRSCADSVCYYGLDISALALSGAKMLHPHVDPENFRLLLSEGSNIELESNAVDFSMSIGVVNHVYQPLQALEKLIDVTRHAVLLVIWVTGEDQGFWAINHSGIANYFFSVNDLAILARKYTKGAFYYANFTPERNSTQPSSYVGISEERLESLGSYTLIFTHRDFVFDELNPIDFAEGL